MLIEQVLINISFVLVIAFLVFLFARILKLPEVLLLIITGYILGNVKYQEFLPINFSEDIIYSISVLALLLVIFTGNMKIKYSLLDKYSLIMLKFVGFFILFELIIFTLLFHFVTSISWQVSALISIIITGASPLVVNLFSHLKGKATTFLNLETDIPSFDAILAFIFFDIFLLQTENPLSSLILGNFKFIILKFIVGFGAGLFVALITYKAMQKHYHQLYTPLGIISTILASYVLAKSLGGSGVLALTTTSVILGNLHVNNIKRGMLPINFLTKIFYLLVGIATGTFIHIPYDLTFFVTSIALYVCFLIIRYLVIHVILGKELKTVKDQIIFTLGSAKGFGAVTLASLLIQSKIPGTELAFTYLIAFLFYSIIISSLTALITNLLQYRKIKNL